LEQLGHLHRSAEATETMFIYMWEGLKLVFQPQRFLESLKPFDLSCWSLLRHLCHNHKIILYSMMQHLVTIEVTLSISASSIRKHMVLKMYLRQI
jgi:hypothetical protein